MNNFPYPMPYNYNLFEEVNNLKIRLKILEDKLELLEKKEESDYLKNDDNYYMI